MSEGSRLSPWIPVGAHRSLNIERHPSASTGSFVPGTGQGFCIHITVSPWMAVDSMVRVLQDKGAEPNLVIGGRPGFTFPVLAQLLALNQWGKALAHPAGTPETNRAAGPQIEICARPGNLRGLRGDAGSTLFDMPEVELPADLVRAAAKAEDATEEHRAGVMKDIDLCMHEDHALARSFQSGVAAWTDDTYKALANVLFMVLRRSSVELRLARSFHNAKRFGAVEFARGVRGVYGHMHVPNNTHFDPTTDFLGRRLVALTKTAPHTL